MSRRNRPQKGKQPSNSPRAKDVCGPATAKLSALNVDVLLQVRQQISTSQSPQSPAIEPSAATATPSGDQICANSVKLEPSLTAPVEPKPRLTASAQQRLAYVPRPKMIIVEESTPKSKVVPRQKLEARPVAPRPTANAPLNVWERRAAAAKQVKKLVECSSPLIEERPATVSAQVRAQVASAIQLGAAIWANRPEPDLQNGFIVGFDFGTSSLKVAVRQPYQAGDPVAALSAPTPLCSDEHPHLWQSVVWFDPKTERFFLTPELGSIALGGFKTGIIGGHSGDRVHPDLPVTRAEAATAFVAMQLAYILGRYQQKRPLGEIGGDHYLAINVGLPVAARDDRKAFDCFTRVLAAAHILAPYSDELTHSDVRSVYQRSIPELPEGFNAVPELLAAISGYAVQPTAPTGPHLLVDVGASTLDLVTFNLLEHTRVSVFTAGVELLGAAALEVARAADVPDGTFKLACDHLFDQVFSSAKKETRAPTLFDPRFRRRDVQLLTTGGGCATDIHSQFVDEMTKVRVLGELPLVRPVPPKTISQRRCDRSRLLLAFGLTRDEPELLELRLPSEIENLPQQHSASIQMVSKDQV
jgi:hypothetical protein